MLKYISATVLLLAVTALALGQPKPAPKQSEFAKLQLAYNKAMQEYYKPYQAAHTQEEMAKIKLDPKKNPNVLYLPKFKTIAEKPGKTREGFQAWMMVRQLSEQSGDTKTSEKATDVIMTRYIATPWVSQFASSLAYGYWNLPAEQRVKKIAGMLLKIEAANPDPEVKANAIYARAQVLAGDGTADIAASTKLYKELIAKYPKTQPGMSAGRDLFEMENLVVGKVAPDFEAEDQDGQKFKLSDYRGKVVVLDFWGFW